MRVHLVLIHKEPGQDDVCQLLHKLRAQPTLTLACTRPPVCAHPASPCPGGNSKTCIIACVSPAPDCAQETYGTLAFAAGAKRIRNRVGFCGRASSGREA